MKRRPFLRTVAGALGTGGCVGRAETPPSAVEATADTTPPDGSLAVDRVAAYDRAVRLNDLGEDPDGEVAEFSGLGDRERAVVDAALAGGYETDDPPTWLVKFASGTAVVEREGTYYRLEHTLPTTAISGEAVAASTVDGEIADHQTYEDAVTHDGRIATGLVRLARREGVELTYVWPGLRRFLREYDAVEYRGTVTALSVEVDDGGPPYRLSAGEASVSAAVDAPVWNAATADPAVRELLGRAAATRGAYGVDAAPDRFFERVAAHPYVYLDGTFYAASVERRESTSVSVDASVADGIVRLSLRNVADRELSVTGPVPAPFGVLDCHPVDDPDDRRLLWSDAYAASDHVRTDGRSVERVADIEVTSSVAPGERVEATYGVRPEALASGRYAVDGSVGVERDGERSVPVRYRVEFTVR
ncbi:hypothetical protein [Halorussus marinus]|uniref:hypothetical protein n=1 Tax=Halorussus marinus TaxID=2505976 RepID=UPI001092F274|nr:hypothetical protein [Halorussus marinus]